MSLQDAIARNRARQAQKASGKPLGSFSIFDCLTHKQVSDRTYETADEANHDYHMNAGHTYVGIITPTRPNEHLRAFTVNVLIIPTVLDGCLFGSKPYEEKLTIYGHSLADAKRRAGIE